MTQASLVQDLWLGFGTRLRGRRLAPWQQPSARLLFQLDPGQALDAAPVAALLESLAERLDVVAWQPRPSGGAPSAELLDDTRRLASDGARAFGEQPLLLGGFGLGAWLALAASDVPGICGIVALAPALAAAGPTAPHPSELRSALASSLVAEPRTLPCLVAEGRDRPAAEARVVSEWLSRASCATHIVAPGADEVLLASPWPAAVAAWAQGTARP